MTAPIRKEIRRAEAAMEQFGAILEGEVSALLATDRYAGGGFDHARLDTLLLGAYRLPAASGFCARPESAG